MSETNENIILRKDLEGEVWELAAEAIFNDPSEEFKGKVLMIQEYVCQPAISSFQAQYEELRDEILTKLTSAVGRELDDRRMYNLESTRGVSAVVFRKIREEELKRQLHHDEVNFTESLMPKTFH